MKYAIRYGDGAQRDYRNEFNWSVRQWGKDHASEFFDRVRGQIAQLRIVPLAYPKPINARGDYRVMVLEGLHIAYTVDQEKMLVIILAIVGRKHYHELGAKTLQALKVRPLA